MDLPSSREIDLETLLRQRDAQIADLTDELVQLRQYLSTQPPPNTSDPISLPPAVVSLLVPHINNDATSSATSSASSTVTAALTQRVKVLQEENDELYELLKTGETGRLKDDVRALRRTVQKLEAALKESHQAIASLSDELEKSHAVIKDNSRLVNAKQPSQSPAPGQSPQTHLSLVASTANGSRKLPPTGPRAHKKPRMSEPYGGNAGRPNIPPLPPPKANRSTSSSTRRNDSRERSPRASGSSRKTWQANVKMEVDEDQRTRPRSPERNRDNLREKEKEKEKDRESDRGSERTRDRYRNKDRERERERDRDRERDRERDKDRDHNERSSSRRNGQDGSGGGGGRRGPRSSSSRNSHSYAAGGDRTLAERMGL
ncbi:hypothetical protein K474DRAFT_1586931 [Panus rudis PR-1116 ss-1]|nr:hypothetical protein K474DRAFT_1586931 [Panus rudis PR-1116 ss-1]